MNSYVKKHKVSFWILAIALALIIVSSCIGAAIQTKGFSIDVSDLRNANAVKDLKISADDVLTVDLTGIPGAESDVKINGLVSSGLLYVPEDASATNKKPAIVLTHGYLNNRELQLPNAVELARRGYVVLVIDREGHGNSTIVPGTIDGFGSAQTGATMYEAAAYLHYLDYVDGSKIAVSGHSMGGAASNNAMKIDKVARDNGDTGIISAGLIQGFPPITSSYHESHNVGILKAMDDEFFFASTFSNGDKSLCREFLQSTGAAGFVGITEFDTATANGINIENGGIYIDGKLVDKEFGKVISDQFRVVYEADEIHPQNHFSTESTAYVIDFMYKALGAPEGSEIIPATKQVWVFKEAMATLGLVGFFALIFPLASLLLTIPMFASLRKKDDLDLSKRLVPLKGVRKNISYWTAGVVTTLCSGFMAEPIMSGKLNFLTKIFFTQNTYYPQDTTGTVATWAIVTGVIALIVVSVIALINSIINKVKYGEEAHLYNESPFETARIDTIGNFFKTLLLGATIVTILYMVVFAIWNIFTVDFRFWTFDVKVFNLSMIPAMMRYSVPFFIFYGINSMFNQGWRLKNLPEWATIAINAFFNVAGIVLVIAIQYITFRSTGVLWQSNMALSYIVLFPIVPVLIVATIISRRLFLKTGNSWLGAFVNTFLFTVMTVSNTSASYAFAGLFA